jgi:hypothetical protein
MDNRYYIVEPIEINREDVFTMVRTGIEPDYSIKEQIFSNEDEIDDDDDDKREI